MAERLLDCTEITVHNQNVQFAHFIFTNEAICKYIRMDDALHYYLDAHS